MPTLPELGLILAMVLAVFAAGRMPALGDALGALMARLYDRGGTPRPPDGDEQR